MGIVDQNFNRLFTSTRQHITGPILTASRTSVERILDIHHERFIAAFINRQADVIAIKCNGQFSSIYTNILAIRCQHVEISLQSYIPFCSGDVLTFRNFLPLSIANAILTIESNLGYSGTDCLRTVDMIEPHHEGGKNNQQQNACHL